MTDKELAKEYRKSLKQRLINEDDFERLEMFDENVEEAFLAGLKAGRPQWHKVADGDLPEKEDVYLIYTTRGVLLGHYEQGGLDGETDFTGEPYSDFTEYPSEMLFTEDEIIAWKEIVLPELKGIE